MSEYCALLMITFMMLMLVKCAPSENKQAIETENTKLNDVTLSADIPQEGNEDSKTSGARQKRWYNYYGYGFPPVNPIIYPNYMKRDDSLNTGNYGPPQDPFVQIHNRLQDITSLIRQSAPPPAISHFPFFFPVIFIPQSGCNCIPNDNRQPTLPSNGMTPNEIENRFNDPRRNWGIVVNETQPRPQPANEAEYDEDASRPISFDVVPPKRPLSRPPPQVDRGTTQAGASGFSAIQNVSPDRPSTFRPARPVLTTTATPPTVKTSSPSACDAAILACCHQPQLTRDCFESRDCTDPNVFSNPCDPGVIFRVIERFREFYGIRT